ncbi:MAG TPA: TolC family protein [Thauera sp.]|nr:TolC family protein [Thauera sp.]
MTRKRHLAGWLAVGLLPMAVHAAPPYEPAAPVPAPRYVPLPLLDTTPQLGEIDWRQANEIVGQFTRGHIDVLRWESENPASGQTEPTPAGALIGASESLRLALAARPDLLATTSMSPAERARADIAAAAFSRDVLRAWVSAVAAETALTNAGKAYGAAETGAELASRMTRVGNWAQDRLLSEQLSLKDAGVGLIAARQEASRAREALTRMTGLWGEAVHFTLPASLPALPADALEGAGLEALALSRHPMLSLATQDAERALQSQGRGAQARWQTLGAEAVERLLGGRADDGAVLSRPPGTAAVIDLRRAAVGQDAPHAFGRVADAESLAVSVRSQVREAYINYRIAHDLATQALSRQGLQVAKQEEALLRYNGMLKSTWDLLDAARERLAAETAAAQALRDFWLAHVNLQAVLAGADYPGADGVAQPAGKKAAGGH